MLESPDYFFRVRVLFSEHHWSTCRLPPSLTSLRLYKAFCIPILLYGCELWSPTETELILLERTHRKILCTISGMPIRCKSIAFQQSLGTINVQNMICQCQLSKPSFSHLPTYPKTLCLAKYWTLGYHLLPPNGA